MPEPKKYEEKKRMKNLLKLAMVLCLMAVTQQKANAVCAYQYYCGVNCDNQLDICQTRCDGLAPSLQDACNNTCIDQWLSCDGWCGAQSCFGPF
jgi:hypothetical protein